MKVKPGLLTTACVAAISLAAFADVQKNDNVDPKEERITKLEQENALLRAENIHLKNKLAERDHREKDDASETEKHAREAIRRLLPNLEIVPPADGAKLPELRYTKPPKDSTGIRVPAAPAPANWIRKRFSGVESHVVPLVMTPGTRDLDDYRRLAAPAR